MRVSGVRAHLVSAAIVRITPVLPDWTVSTRVHGTFGQIRAPITCPDEALADPVSECFGGTRSDDEYRPNIVGVDGALGWRPSNGRLSLYGGVGYTLLEPRFRVNFTNSQGSQDRRRVEVDLDRFPFFAGLAWQPSATVSLAGEWYGTRPDGSTVRMTLRANP